MDDKRREEIIKALKMLEVTLDETEDGLFVECFIHDEALDLFMRAINLTEKLHDK